MWLGEGDGHLSCEVGWTLVPRAGPAADLPSVSHAVDRQGSLGRTVKGIECRREGPSFPWAELWLEERLGLGRREFSPRAHRLSRLQIYKLKIINNSNQAVINLRSLSMNPDSIS